MEEVLIDESVRPELWSISKLLSLSASCHLPVLLPRVGIYLRLSLVSCDWGCHLFGPLQYCRLDTRVFMAALYPLDHDGLLPLKG